MYICIQVKISFDYMHESICIRSRALVIYNQIFVPWYKLIILLFHVHKNIFCRCLHIMSDLWCAAWWALGLYWLWPYVVEKCIYNSSAQCQLFDVQHDELWVYTIQWQGVRCMITVEESCYQVLSWWLTCVADLFGCLSSPLGLYATKHTCQLGQYNIWSL